MPAVDSESSERQPLLSKKSNAASWFSAAEHDPTFLQSYRSLLLGSWINLLLVFIPLSFLSHLLDWGATPTFIISFMAIVPLAALLGESTEELSLRVGQTLGALLNATFGNAIEAIIGVIALVQGELTVVQTSMLGSILSNILLVLGCSLFAAGFKRSESTFQATAAQNSASVLMLATATLILPAAYHATVGLTGNPDPDAAAKQAAGLLFLSRGASVILVGIYGCYLWFQMKTHAFLFEATASEEEEEVPKMNMPAALSALLVVTVITSFCADFLVESIDEFANRFGLPKAFIGLILIPIVGNAAEHVTSVWMAMKGKMEITIGVCVGSSIQIAVGVIPFLVLLGKPLGRDLTLFFGNFETVCFFVSVLMVTVVLIDGKSNYLEGIMLLALYAAIAISFWVS